MHIRAKAPLRISFAGGGTDVPPYPQLEGGCVLSATINRYAYGTLHPRGDRNICVCSLDFGSSITYDPQDKLVYDGKLDDVKAAIRKLRAAERGGFDLVLHSDLPPGTGLGASSAMIVALVGVMKEFENLPLTDYEIADLACVIERDELQVQGGLQDQYAATFGGVNYIEFLPDRVVVNSLKISADVLNELQYNLLLCYSGTSHLSGQILADQVSRYESREAETVQALRELKALTIEMKNALLRGELAHFGELLHLEWLHKRKLSPRISTARLDALYEAAREYGAVGGKVSGAGGGGHMLLYCRQGRKQAVAEGLKKAGCTITDFGIEMLGLQTWRVNGHDEDSSGT